MSDLRDKLARELMATEWRMLAMHYRRDALFMVRRSVSLLDAAVAVAEDRTEEVRGWLEAGSLARPSPEEIEAWEAESGTKFVSAVVQPYVLAQRVEDFGGGNEA